MGGYRREQVAPRRVLGLALAPLMVLGSLLAFATTRRWRRAPRP